MTDDRLERRIAARGRVQPSRLHVAVEQPTDEGLGDVVAIIKARCGACGTDAHGALVKYEHGEVWEQAGDRFPWFEITNFLCPTHGRLPFADGGRNRDRLDRESVDAEYAKAVLRRDRCARIKLRPAANND